MKTESMEIKVLLNSNFNPYSPNRVLFCFFKNKSKFKGLQSLEFVFSIWHLVLTVESFFQTGTSLVLPRWCKFCIPR